MTRRRAEIAMFACGFGMFAFFAGAALSTRAVYEKRRLEHIVARDRLLADIETGRQESNSLHFEPGRLFAFDPGDKLLSVYTSGFGREVCAVVVAEDGGSEWTGDPAECARWISENMRAR